MFILIKVWLLQEKDNFQQNIVTSPTSLHRNVCNNNKNNKENENQQQKKQS